MTRLTITTEELSDEETYTRTFDKDFISVEDYWKVCMSAYIAFGYCNKVTVKFPKDLIESIKNRD